MIIHIHYIFSLVLDNLKPKSFYEIPGPAIEYIEQRETYYRINYCQNKNLYKKNNKISRIFSEYFRIDEIAQYDWDRYQG